MAIADIKHERRAPWSILLRLRHLVGDRLTGEYFTTQRVVGNAFAIRVAGAGIAFASQALIARWIGAYEFGFYVYVWTWLILTSDLVHLGLPLTAQRFIPEYTQQGSFDLLRGFLSGCRWLTLASGIVIALLSAVIVRALSASLDPKLIVPLYFACAALPVYGLTFMVDGLARSYNWINLALLPAYIIRPLLLLASLAVLHAAGRPIDAATVMGTLTLVAWLAALWQANRLNRKLAGVVTAGPKRHESRRWLVTALPIVVVWGLYSLLTSTDVLVLEQFRSAEVVAHYFAAAKILALVSIIYFAVAACTAHRFTAYHVTGDHAGLANFAASTVRWVFWPSLALSLLIVVCGRPLLMLFGHDFVAGYPVMVILAAGQLARASIGPAERLLNTLGQQRTCAFAYAATFAFNIGACLLLAPAYGAIGAAMATAGAFTVESTLLFVIAKRRLGLHMFVGGRAMQNDLTMLHRSRLIQIDPGGFNSGSER